LWLVVAIQVAIPTSYYLRDGDPDDERFAWRMFSGVRLKRCQVSATVRLPGGPRAIPLQRVLHSSWIHGLERGRLRVVERFLSEECRHNHAPEVTLERRCRAVQGGALPPERYRAECATGAIRREQGE
jgi:hypothetical protein